MKILISANVVRREHAAGHMKIPASPAMSIITPEARTVADKLGVVFVDEVLALPALVANNGSSSTGAATGTESDLYEAVRAQVMAKLPKGSVPDTVVTQLIEKVMKEGRSVSKTSQPMAQKTPHYTFQKIAGGIKRVDGPSVNFGKLRAASVGDSIGIADVVTAADGSPMAAGFMAWNNCFFPWTLNYNEIDVVLEGELHIRCDRQEVVCRVGDVVFIPNGSSIEFGTPTSTRFLYVTYPADWQAQ